MHDNENDSPVDETLAEAEGGTVVNLFTVIHGRDEEYVDLDLRDDEGVDIDDLAWVALRIVKRQLAEVDWMELAGLASPLVDESDIGVVRGLLAQVKINVEIPGFDL